MLKTDEISFLDKVLCKMKEPYSSDGTIYLNESGGDASLNNILVTKVSPVFFALKPDKCGFQIFSSGYGSKQCDYILLSEFRGTKVAVFVELKSSVPLEDACGAIPTPDENGNYEDYVTQLTSSSCLLDFLNSVLSNFCKCNELSTYMRYYTVLHNTDVPPIGEEISLTRPESNDSPQKAYIRKTDNNETMTLGHLIR